MKTLLVACSGIILFSTWSIKAQLPEWQVRRSPLSEHLYSVTHGERLYVAVGNNRTILTSSNGTSWTVRMHNTNGHGWLCGVAHGNGTFVAVGNGFQRSWPLSSPSTWGPPGSAGFSLNSNAAPILVSKDGVYWKPLRPGAGSLSAVAFGRGRFVAAGLGGLITSRDGFTWLYPTNFYRANGERLPIKPGDVVWFYLPPVPSQIAFGNGRFVVRSWRGASMISTNGLDWISFASPATPASTLDLLGFGASRFVSPTYLSSGSGKVVTSQNGMDWSQTGSLSFRVISFGPGHRNSVVAGGMDMEGRAWVKTSADGLDWSGEATQVAVAPYGIAHGLRGVVAVGANGFIIHSPLPPPVPNSGAFSLHPVQP